MTVLLRSSPRQRRRPISAAEVAALAGIELDPVEFEPDRRGTWTAREHSQLKRQWRFVRSLPYIVQFIIALFALTWFVFCFCVTLLVVGGLTMR